MATAGYQGNGFFGSLFGPQQVGTSTTATQTTYPDWFNAAATANTLPFMQPQKDMLAGFNEDQLMAGKLARQGAATAYGNDWSGQIAGAGSGYAPSTVDGADIAALKNPYLDAVGADTLDAMRREYGNTDAAIGARNASGVAFGGSGAALERAQNNRAHGEQVASAINTLQAQGYDAATQVALANAGMENDASQFNSQQKLSALIGANAASNDTQSRQRYALEDLLGFGNQAQAQAQKGLDIPLTAMQRYLSLQPGSQTTSTPEMMNPIESLLGMFF